MKHLLQIMTAAALAATGCASSPPAADPDLNVQLPSGWTAPDTPIPAGIRQTRSGPCGAGATG